MTWRREVAKVGALLRRRKPVDDLAEEIRSHLAMEEQENLESGMTPEEAHYAARRRFGNVTLAQERSREMWEWNSLETLGQDLRYALRMLAKNPGFTVVAALTLALGIGANTAIFSVVNTVLLRPLPYKDPGRLVNISETNLKAGFSQTPVSYPDFLNWRAQNHAFESIAAYNWNPFTLTSRHETLHVEGYLASAELFSVLGVQPALGRGFLPEEDQPGHRVAVLSHNLWQGHFGSDPKVVGQSIRMDRMSFTVVGVMPAGFQFPIQAKPVEIWVAQGVNPEVPGRGNHYFSVIARLRPHTTLATARAEMATIANRLAKEYPNYNRDLDVKLIPEYERLVGDVRPSLLILFGAVIFILLIACANVANLLLARGTYREREIAIRAAIGAGHRRIMRQLLTESFLLAGLGGALGLLFAIGATRFLLSLGPADIPRLSENGLDARVLIFSVATILITGLSFGLAPAWRTAKVDLIKSLKTAGAISEGPRRHSFRAALIVSEMALTLILLAGAGLMINSLFRLTRIDPGFNPRGVLTFAVDLSDKEYTPEQSAARVAELLDRIRQSPSVRAAAADTSLPLSWIETMYSAFQVGATPTPDSPSAAISIVTPDFFRTLGIPLLEGRDFNVHDDLKAPPVVVVSQSLARRYFPGQDAIGKQITTGLNAGENVPFRRIIGVAGDVRRDSLTDTPPVAIYLPHGQLPDSSMRFVVRSTAPLPASVDAVRAAVRSVDKDLPLYEIKTLDQYLGLAMGQSRFNTLVLGLFAVLAVVLSAVGLYGVVSYAAGRRTHEFGVRMAMGATRGDVIRTVLSRALAMVGIGLAIGLAAALVLTRFLANQLYGVKSNDPLTFTAVSAAFAAVALLASYIPARRATKVDPMVALRCE